jgi:hypothetical protein
MDPENTNESAGVYYKTNESAGVYYKDGDVPQASEAVTTESAGRGHIFCGFCCDMRRAVIIVNTVNISLVILSSLLILVFSLHFDFDGEDIRAPSIQEVIRISLPAVILSGFGITGALKFKYWMIVLVGFYYGFMVLLDMIILDIPGVVRGGLFCYPHVILSQEIDKGIMSEENYPNAKHSCCCV